MVAALGCLYFSVVAVVVLGGGGGGGGGELFLSSMVMLPGCSSVVILEGMGRIIAGLC